MKRYVEQPRPGGQEQGPDHDAALLADVLLAREKDWRNGEGRILITRDEFAKAVATHHADHHVLALVPCDRTGRDCLHSQATHYRVDLIVAVPQ